MRSAFATSVRRSTVRLENSDAACPRNSLDGVTTSTRPEDKMNGNAVITPLLPAPLGSDKIAGSRLVEKCAPAANMAPS
jgi:hypothetical protein